ncbi:hypothetical protein KAFR_0F02900 [Kazachstania africana CBS 2517]|uniref:DUF1766-domain-containing protein n=1 Tax=Kazachstania africana (strain ATCC 22294 / BCRC 22015 / CBS 2517 / CECT 1963 / NBRC 1671 / NRRL Y-8276) TaxID=1071382 RepID=H2AWY6_KAZAF|nr:hypothetical protein KAFR_0F02900 [Kazachstania africana CBS 2517]CCF58886.1 hypothetical protein KAFR_0F02900 [Kazachstania africana CBS 2517]
MFDSLIAGSHKKLNWIMVDNSIIDPKNVRKDKWEIDGHILCKVGMTTKKDVKLRLSEWKKQCTFDVINLTPANIDLLLDAQNTKSSSGKTDSLSTLMSKLSLNKKKNKATNKFLTRKAWHLYTYRSGGFYTDGRGELKLPSIENGIHELFRKKYGKCYIYCAGCGENRRTRHCEWFKMPINDLPTIMKSIDDFCLSQSKA